MNIIVCVKEIPDPEIPAKAFQIDADKKRAVLPGGRKMIISDYDESAAEAALRIKDSTDSNITILSLGQESAQEVIRHCLSMGCDEGILISDPLFDDTDSFATASVLAESIKKKGQFDLILCGVVLHGLLQRYLSNEVDNDLRVYSARVHGTLNPKEMPEHLREVTIMILMEGFAQKDAAVVLGCSESSVSRDLETARKWLSARLEKLI